MTTMTRERPPVKSSRVHATLCMTIGDVGYGVEKVEPGEFGTRAWRLSKLSAGGEVYDLIRRHDGSLECDCASFVFTHAGEGSHCKHLSAAIRLGLLDPPAIVEAKPAPLVNRNNVTVDKIVPAKARSDRDRAAAKAFGVRLPAKAAAPAPATPREIGDRIVAMLACPDCQGEGCAACDDAPAPCCSPAESSAPCSACVGQAPAEPAVEPDVDIGNVTEPPAYACGCPAPSTIDPAILDNGCPACLAEMAEALAAGPPEAPGGPQSDDRGDDGRMGLAEWLDAQSELYALLDCGAGDLLSRHIQTLAQTVRAVMTPGVAWITPIEAESRMEALAGA